MAAGSASSFDRESRVILATLSAFAVAAWGLVLGQALRPPEMDDMASGLTMGLSALFFLGIWVAMMVAMMFPTAAPMILTFARVSASKRERGLSFVPTWVFTGTYLGLWTLFGMLAYGLARAAEAAATQTPWLTDHAAQIGAGLVVLAGLYQLSPLKHVCLAKCRMPLTFVLTSWRDGWTGAVRMGLEHGVYCLGCCWLLFAILFPLGMMNVAAMAALTVLIYAEKSLPLGERVAQAAALVLIVAGLLALALPGVLPASGAMPTGM